MTILNQSFTFANGVVAKNRFFKGAMSEQITRGNHPNAAYVKLYETWAKGGAGILVTGNVMVDYRALGGFDDVVVEDERDLDALKQWAKAGTQNNTLLLMQINHPGKQSPKSTSPEPVAPSAVPLGEGLADLFAPPRALTETEILALIQRFANTAVIAEKAGFSGVQIHAAHGYLISQFLSPHHNRREDQWGGNLANRMRFLLEIYREMRRRTQANFIVGVKLNSADFQKGGFNEEDSMAVIQALSDEGIDFIEISGGNYEAPAMLQGVKDTTKKREAYFLDYAAKARQVSKVPLVVTGGFRSQNAMEDALSSGHLDFVGLAKPFAVMPDLPNRVMNGQYQTLKLKPVRTGVKALDKKLGSVLEMGWYMYQMKRLSQGKCTCVCLSAWSVLFFTLLRNGLAGLKKERA